MAPSPSSSTSLKRLTTRPFHLDSVVDEVDGLAVPAAASPPPPTSLPTAAGFTRCCGCRRAPSMLHSFGLARPRCRATLTSENDGTTPPDRKPPKKAEESHRNTHGRQRRGV